MSDYLPDDSKEVWWCNTHNRKATFLFKDRHVCNPDLGGIMISCQAVNITNDLKIDEFVNEELEAKNEKFETYIRQVIQDENLVNRLFDLQDEFQKETNTLLDSGYKFENIQEAEQYANQFFESVRDLIGDDNLFKIFGFIPGQKIFTNYMED